jgi:hypothetical protein
MLKSSLLAFLLIPVVAFGQLMISGKTLSKSADAIPFVNIGVVGREIGTSSDASGQFTLNLSLENIDDTILFSAIGYHSVWIRVEQLLDGQQKEIRLEEKVTQLQDVTVMGGKLREVVRGRKKPGKSSGRVMGKAPGAQFARKFNSKGKTICVKDVSAYFTSFRVSVTLRLRIYDFENEVQGADLLNINVFVGMGKLQDWVTVDISEHNVCSDKQILIGYEWLDDNFKGPMVSIGGISYDTYYRLASHGKWNQLIDMNWTIKATLWVE